MLPEPTLSFTLPSLHDGLPLDCRIYHPQSLAASPDAPAWQKHAAIVAHPYAPLGGCYDDPVVDIVAGTLLRLGFLVGTFNFRGAHGSAGRTSWTAKAESSDYKTAVGFVSHYVHFLDPFSSKAIREARDAENGSSGPGTPVTPRSPLKQPASTIPATPTRFSPQPLEHVPVLLLGGYSYGAMVTTNLPPLESILEPFTAPACGSAAAEIRLRAQHLAEMQNTILASARAAAIDRQNKKSYRKSLGMRVGGDEENRKSHDSRRSFSLDLEDRIHKGVSELMAKARKGHRRHSPIVEQVVPEGEEPRASPESHAESPQQTPTMECLLPISNRITHRPAYLLVSPLQGVVTNLATMSFPSPFTSLARRLPTRSPSWSVGSIPQPGGNEGDSHKAEPLTDSEEKLVSNPTLAIYGDRDGFVAARKLREWASRLETVPDSRFRAHEVSGAGHFWAQGNAGTIMRDAIRVFAEGVLGDAST